jgi:hypothetical protein
MAALLVDAKRRCDRAREQGRSELPRGQRQLVRDRYDAILADYFAANAAPPGGWPKGSYARDAANLAIALRERRPDVLRFVADLAVPFDNYADVRVMPMLGRQPAPALRFGAACSA